MKKKILDSPELFLESLLVLTMNMLMQNVFPTSSALCQSDISLSSTDGKSTCLAGSGTLVRFWLEAKYWLSTRDSTAGGLAILVASIQFA